MAQAYKEEPRHLVHGAYDRSALSFDGLGLAEVSNLGRLSYDIRLTDVAHAILSFCVTREAPQAGCRTLDPAGLATFLTAYEQTSPFTELETQILPLVLRANQLLKTIDDSRRLIEAQEVDQYAAGTDLRAQAISLALRMGPITHRVHRGGEQRNRVTTRDRHGTEREPAGNHLY